MQHTVRCGSIRERPAHLEDEQRGWQLYLVQVVLGVRFWLY